MGRKHLRKPRVTQALKGGIAHNPNHREPGAFRAVLTHADALADRIAARKEPARQRGVDDGYLGALIAVVPIAEIAALKEGNTHRTKIARRHLSEAHNGDRFPRCGR